MPVTDRVWMLTIQSTDCLTAIESYHHSCPQMTMSWRLWDTIYEWKLVISCLGSLCELMFALNLKPCPRFREASQRWERLSHLNTVELHQPILAWMNSAGVWMLWLFASASHASVQSIYVCMIWEWKRECVYVGLSRVPEYRPGFQCAASMWYTM